MLPKVSLLGRKLVLRYDIVAAIQVNLKTTMNTPNFIQFIFYFKLY